MVRQKQSLPCLQSCERINSSVNHCGPRTRAPGRPVPFRPRLTREAQSPSAPQSPPAAPPDPVRLLSRPGRARPVPSRTCSAGGWRRAAVSACTSGRRSTPRRPSPPLPSSAAPTSARAPEQRAGPARAGAEPSQSRAGRQPAVQRWATAVSARGPPRPRGIISIQWGHAHGRRAG